MKTSRLVIDIGGTNVRFACASGTGELDQLARFPTASFATFEDALSAYLSRPDVRDGLTSCAIAAAGPVDDGCVHLTNAGWTVERSKAAGQLGGMPVALVNDLEAVAAALPYLSVNDRSRLAGPEPVRAPPRRMLAFNIGTGCGAATALPCGGTWRTVPSEAGHMSLAVDNISLNSRISPGATVESVLSGDGVVRLYENLAGRSGSVAPLARDAAEVFARVGEDEAARETVAIISDLIGRVSGDLVLATAAWGGVYFAGSVAKGWARVADTAAFRDAFERKGAMSERMRTVAACIIEREDAAMLGLAMLGLATLDQT